MTYLLDANTLIEAKNRYYQMHICPGYWDWLANCQGRSLLSSVESVGNELRCGNDELADWAKQHPELFLSESDEATQIAFAEVAQHVQAQSATMKAGAMEEFLRGADPWLIAKARATGYSIVTHERLDIQAKRKFLIPNVCEHFGVRYLNTFDMLGNLGAQFVLA